MVCTKLEWPNCTATLTDVLLYLIVTSSSLLYSRRLAPQCQYIVSYYVHSDNPYMYNLFSKHCRSTAIVWAFWNHLRLTVWRQHKYENVIDGTTVSCLTTQIHTFDAPATTNLVILDCATFIWAKLVTVSIARTTAYNEKRNSSSLTNNYEIL